MTLQDLEYGEKSEKKMEIEKHILQDVNMAKNMEKWE